MRTWASASTARAGPTGRSSACSLSRRCAGSPASGAPGAPGATSTPGRPRSRSSWATPSAATIRPSSRAGAVRPGSWRPCWPAGARRRAWRRATNGPRRRPSTRGSAPPSRGSATASPSRGSTPARRGAAQGAAAAGGGGGGAGTARHGGGGPGRGRPVARGAPDEPSPDRLVVWFRLERTGPDAWRIAAEGARRTAHDAQRLPERRNKGSPARCLIANGVTSVDRRFLSLARWSSRQPRLGADGSCRAVSAHGQCRLGASGGADMGSLALATILAVVVLLASTVSVELGLSVACSSWLGGVSPATPSACKQAWLDFIASFASVVLTFLAGAEVDLDHLRERRRRVGIGLVVVRRPVRRRVAAAYVAARLDGAGVADRGHRAVDDVARGRLRRPGRDRAQPTRRREAADERHVRDRLGTAIALSAIFITPNGWFLLFLAVSVALIGALPRLAPWFFGRYGDRVIEPEIKLVFVCLFVLMVLGGRVQRPGGAARVRARPRDGAPLPGAPQGAGARCASSRSRS